jgi:hypothetical protein
MVLDNNHLKVFALCESAHAPQEHCCRKWPNLENTALTELSAGFADDTPFEQIAKPDLHDPC